MNKILSTFAIILLFQSCTKNDKSIVQTQPLDKTEIMSKSAAEQVKYAEKNLEAIGTEIAKLVQNKDFRTYVHNEVKKKFDEEYEVLIQDLFKNTIWRNKVEYAKIDLHLNQFKNLGGANYYPQIYIPKFQEIEDKGNAKNNANLGGDLTADSIVYIYYAGDSEVDSATNENESYAGYVMNSIGQMVYWGMVNEEYANNNEVWIISLNESVGNEGNFCPPALINGVNTYCPDNLGGCCTGGGGGENPPPTGCNGAPDCDPVEMAKPPHPDMGTHFPVNCKIENMIVKERKESWLAGASEIAIRASLNCHNNLELGRPASIAVSTQYRSDQHTSFIGNLIKKFKRKEVRNQSVKNVNFSLQTNWPTQYYQSDPIWFDYVIFERDLFPAKINRSPWGVQSGRVDLLNLPYSGVPSVNWDLFYRSGGVRNGWNYYYNKSSFTSNNLLSPGQSSYYATGYVNNDEITFNTIAY